MDDGLGFAPFDKRLHRRDQFDCGVPALNEYLRTRLGQHSRRHITRGYVLAAADGTIAGYVTLAAGRLMVSVVPQAAGFPPRLPLPSTLIGRLAVDTRFRGRGLGERLLGGAIRLAVQTAKVVASAVIEVDAKDEAARAFYMRYGFSALPDSPDHLYLPMEVAQRAFGGPHSPG